MNKRYSFSLNGTDWRGNYSSRKEARQAALEATRDQSEPAREVYVGQIIAADFQTNGHARYVIREINRRADAAGIGEYLSGLKLEQVAELDKELAGVIGHWILRHKLEPTNFTVNAISEYPVPLPPTIKSEESDEVTELGQSRETELMQ